MRGAPFAFSLTHAGRKKPARRSDDGWLARPFAATVNIDVRQHARDWSRRRAPNLSSSGSFLEEAELVPSPPPHGQVASTYCCLLHRIWCPASFFLSWLRRARAHSSSIEGPRADMAAQQRGRRRQIELALGRIDPHVCFRDIKWVLRVRPEPPDKIKLNS